MDRLLRLKARTNLADLPSDSHRPIPVGSEYQIFLSPPTITELVVESTDCGIESADSTTDSAADPVKIDLWVRATL